MAFDHCPNCYEKSDRAIYQCSECDEYGCMRGTLGGYGGTYSGCWTDKECPHCGETGTKDYRGRVVDE